MAQGTSLAAASQACVVSLIQSNGLDKESKALCQRMVGEYICAGKNNGFKFYVRINGQNIYYDDYWGWCIGSQLGGDPEAWNTPEKDGSIPETGWKARGYLGWHDDLPLKVRTVILQDRSEEPKEAKKIAPDPAGRLSKETTQQIAMLRKGMRQGDQCASCLEGSTRAIAGCCAMALEGIAEIMTADPLAKRSIPALTQPVRITVERNQQGLKGADVNVSSQRAYFAKPAHHGAPSKEVGVLVVHDIFGFGLPNCRYIADYFARQGFPALLPDFFSGKGLSLNSWPANEFDEEPLDRPEFGTWWTEITSDEYFGKMRKHTSEAVSFLKANECRTIAIVGFDWGGWAAERLAGFGFASAASIHGAHTNADNYLLAVASGCKEISYQTVPEDPFFPASAIDSLQKAGAGVTVWPGMQHGFTVRGDFQNNPRLSETADQALYAVVEQFSKLANPGKDITEVLKEMSAAQFYNPLTPSKTQKSSNEELAKQKEALEEKLEKLASDMKAKDDQREAQFQKRAEILKDQYLKNNQELEAVAANAVEELVQLRPLADENAQLRAENESLKIERSSLQAASGPGIIGALQTDIQNLQEALGNKEVEVETLTSLKDLFERRQIETAAALETAQTSLVERTSSLKQMREDNERQAAELTRQRQALAELQNSQSEEMRAELEFLKRQLADRGATVEANSQLQSEMERVRFAAAEEIQELQNAQTQLESQLQGEIFTLKLALEQREALATARAQVAENAMAKQREYQSEIDRLNAEQAEQVALFREELAKRDADIARLSSQQAGEVSSIGVPRFKSAGELPQDDQTQMEMLSVENSQLQQGLEDEMATNAALKQDLDFAAKDIKTLQDQVQLTNEYNEKLQQEADAVITRLEMEKNQLLSQISASGSGTVIAPEGQGALMAQLQGLREINKEQADQVLTQQAQYAAETEEMRERLRMLQEENEALKALPSDAQAKQGSPAKISPLWKSQPAVLPSINRTPERAIPGTVPSLAVRTVQQGTVLNNGAPGPPAFLGPPATR